MECKACGAANPSYATSCRQCGHSFVEPAETAPPPDASPSPKPEAPDAYMTYQPSGKCPPLAVVLMAVAGGISALVVGVIYFFVAQWYDLFIIFPLGAGFVVGAGMWWGVRRGKCRNQRIAFCMGALASVLMYGVRLTGDYVRFLHYDLPAALAVSRKIPLEQAREQTLEAVRSTGYAVSFGRFLTARAESGVRLSRASSTRRGIEFSGMGYWLVFLVEFGLAGGAAGLVTSTIAGERFCEDCDKWYHAYTLRRFPVDLSDEIVEAIESGNYADLSTLSSDEPVTGKSKCEIGLNHCPSCRSLGRVTVSQTYNGTTRQLLARTVNAAQIAAIRQAVQSPSQTAEPVS